MHHPSASKSSAGISPSCEARQNSSTLGLRGFFHIRPYERSKRCFARPFAPAPRAEPGSPWAPFSSGRVPRWGLRGLVDHLNLSGNKRLVSEPSVGAPLCREVWEQPVRRSWTKANLQLYQHVQEKITAGKEIQPAASLPCRNHEFRVLGACFKNGAWVCTSLRAPFVCASSPASSDASMQPCPALRGAPGEQHVLGYLRLYCATCELTQLCSDSGHVRGLGPEQHPWVLEELARSGWRLCGRQAGSSGCRQSTPVSPADLATVAGRDQPRR